MIQGSPPDRAGETAIPCGHDTRVFVGFSFGDMLFILLFPAAVVWSLGSIVVHVEFHVRSRSSSKIHGGHDT